MTGGSVRFVLVLIGIIGSALTLRWMENRAADRQIDATIRRVIVEGEMRRAKDAAAADTMLIDSCYIVAPTTGRAGPRWPTGR